MQKLLYLSILAVFLLCINYGCQKPLPHGGKPFYIKIDSAQVQIMNPSVQGSASSKIEQVWVEIGGQNLGVYALPIKFPVLSETGTFPLLIQAGIKNKGIAAQREVYQMLQAYSQDITFDEATNTYTIKPVFVYKSACNFEMNETFEFSNNFDLNMNVVNDTNVFEGANSGMMEFAPLSGKIIKANNVSIPISRVAYLEFNYKTDMPFSVGLISNLSGNVNDVQLMVVDTKPIWNKMYINLTPEITNLNAVDYQFYFKSYNDDSTSIKHIYIDNFKVVYL